MKKSNEEEPLTPELEEQLDEDHIISNQWVLDAFAAEEALANISAKLAEIKKRLNRKANFGKGLVPADDTPTFVTLSTMPPRYPHPPPQRLGTKILQTPIKSNDSPNNL